jgi:CcmD family protein
MAVTVPVAAGGVYASSDGVGGPAPQLQTAQPQQEDEDDGDPEANLPYLFAVYIVTWAGFFGYVFVMSRRQREMRREIDALKVALTDKEPQRDGA